MKIITANFVTSAVGPKQYPPPELPELAFVGRSNVGKSSLLNSLLNRKKLVKTSSTPGKTQMINFFEVNKQFMFADLPGYGFAKVPHAVKKKWQKLIEGYLLDREALVAVVFLVDIRRKPGDLDLDMKHWLETCGIDYIAVATKSDKLKGHERKKQIQRLREVFSKDGPGGELLLYSSKNDWGRKELWKLILDRIEFKKSSEKITK